MLFTVFFFFSNTLSANEPYLDTILKINSGNLIKSPNLSCREDQSYGLLARSAEARPNSNLNLNQCAIDLCGKPGNNPSVWVVDQNFSTSISPTALRKANALKPLLKKMFEASTKDQLSDAEKMKSFSNNVAQNLKTMDHFAKNNLAKNFFEPFFNVTVDKSLPLFERVVVKTELPENASVEFKEALNNFIQNMKKEMLENPYFTEFQVAVREEDLIILAQKRYNETITLLGTVASKQDMQKLNEALNKQPFDRMAYIQFNNKINDLKEATKQKEALLCNVANCDLVMVEFFSSQKTKDQIAEFEKILKSPQTIERSIAKCQAQVIAADLKQTSQAKALTLFNKARSQILERFVPLYSAHSQSLMRDYLLNKLSGSHRDIKKEMNNLDPFTSIRQQIESHLKFRNSLIPIERVEFYAEKIIQNSQNPELIYPFGQMGPCSKLGSNAWDSFLPAYTARDRFNKDDREFARVFAPHDAVFVSDFSCQHAQHGVHNVSHEIGHAINSLFLTSELSTDSKKKYDEMRSCAANLYPKSPLSRLFYFPPGDKTTTEEDVADLIAFHSLNDEKKIYSCALLKPSNVSSNYQELTLFDNDSDNVHSTSISRALQEAFHKGITIPQSCLEVLEKENSNFRFQKCI
jgi:hypothetical protein